jgi:hypothetical protein
VDGTAESEAVPYTVQTLVSEVQMEQKPSVILASDGVGYSRLMGIDERGTLSAALMRQAVTEVAANL